MPNPATARHDGGWLAIPALVDEGQHGQPQKEGDAPAWHNPYKDLTPSLLCLAVISDVSTEEVLVKYQLQTAAGIFKCNDFVVFSPEETELGTFMDGSLVKTWPNRMINKPRKKPWENVEIFRFAFNDVIKSGKVQENDFTLKADPQTVLLPDRLRTKLLSYRGEARYFATCDDSEKGEVLYGAVEVYTAGALMAYNDKSDECMALDWEEWGEDFFMQTCMDRLGIKMATETKLIADTRCDHTWGKCFDNSMAAFHPYSEITDWQNCLKAASSGKNEGKLLKRGQIDCAVSPDSAEECTKWYGCHWFDGDGGGCRDWGKAKVDAWCGEFSLESQCARAGVKFGGEMKGDSFKCVWSPSGSCRRAWTSR